MSTYLQLTNSAISESGVDLDALTSGNFASTTDPLAVRFKGWVNQSLREIEMERNEWSYKNKKAQVVIYPRLHVIDGDRATEPPADSTYEGVDSGSTFTVVDVTLLSGAWASGTAEAYIDLLDLSGPYSFNELYDETAPTAANADVFRAKWFGRYPLDTIVSDLFEANNDTFTIQGASGLADTDLNTGDTDIQKLTFVPWNLFNTGMERTQQFSRPYCFTQTPSGEYDFYPRPNQAYILTFDYSAEPQTLSAHGDSVTDMPALYQDMIVWRTVMYYADYDSKPAMFARAERRYEYYKNRAERNLMPPPTFAWNRYASTW